MKQPVALLLQIVLFTVYGVTLLDKYVLRSSAESLTWNFPIDVSTKHTPYVSPEPDSASCWGR